VPLIQSHLFQPTQEYFLANSTKFEEKADDIHFKLIANTHILHQSQLFNVKYTYSESISTETNKARANHYYFKWNTYILSKLQPFQLKRAQPEPVTTSATRIVWVKGNYLHWNAQSLSQLQL